MEPSLNVNWTPVLQTTLPVLVVASFVLVGFLLLLYKTPPSMRDLLQAVAKRGGWLKAWRPELKVEKPAAPETATIPVAQAPPEAEQGKQPGAKEEAPLFVRIMDAYHQGDREEVDELTDQFIREASNGDERLDRQGWQLYFQFRLGDTSALPRLGALAQQFPDNPSLTEFMALSYSVSGEHNRAATLYRQAAEKTQEEEDRVRLTIQAAEELRQAGLKEQAATQLKELITSIASAAQRARAYAALADAEGDRVGPDRAAELYEQSLQENPGNAEVRFKLAYLYGEMGRHELSLFHYQKLRQVPAERAGEGINNLAIEYSRLEMPIKAVRTYTLASDRGSTIAMANLARVMLGAGLVEEANQWLDRAEEKYQNDPGIHNVRGLIGTLAGEEDEKEKKSLEWAPIERSVRLRLAAGRTQRSAQDLQSVGGRWQVERREKLEADTKTDELTFACSDEKLAAQGGDLRLSGNFQGLVADLSWQQGTWNSGSGAIVFDESLTEFEGFLQSSEYTTHWRLIKGHKL